MPLQRPSPLAALSAAANRSVPPVVQPAAESAVRRGLASVRVIAFWTAILLPVTYLPMLFGVDAFGLAGSEPRLILGLIALNLLAFLLGHEYNQPDAA